MAEKISCWCVDVMMETPLVFSLRKPVQMGSLFCDWVGKTAKSHANRGWCDYLRSVTQRVAGGDGEQEGQISLVLKWKGCDALVPLH
jgi:hypothetical protein